MIRNIIRKLAVGLARAEREELLRWFTSVDNAFGTRRIGMHSFAQVEIGKIVPVSTLLYPFVSEKEYHATDTPITDDTFTVVTFNANKYGDNDAFRLDADNQRVWINTRAKALYAGIAHAWEPNVTGRRRADFQYFDEAGNTLGTALLNVEQGFGGDENWFTPARLADLPDHTAYIKARVKQTSGGDLNLVYFALDLHIV